MNKKLIVLISCLVTVLLLACCFVFPFTRNLESAWTNLLTVSINDTFDSATVEAAVREAGASDVLVLKQVYRTGSTAFREGVTAQIYFNVPEGTDAQSVKDKADEILRLTYLTDPGTLTQLSATLTKQSVLSLWPVLIVLVVLLAYAFVRFGVKTGVLAVSQLLIAVIAAAGVTAAAHIGVSRFTIIALFATAALSELFVFLYAIIEREYAKKVSTGAAGASDAVLRIYVAVLSCLAVVGLTLVLILGNVLLKEFALTALAGVVFNACAAAFTMPALASLFAKEN